MTVRACLLVLLCRAHPPKSLTQYLPYPAYPTVVSNVRHTNSTLPDGISSPPCLGIAWGPEVQVVWVPPNLWERIIIGEMVCRVLALGDEL
jgi:hypothetical protein